MMDIRNGKLYSADDYIPENDYRFIVTIQNQPSEEQINRKKILRNDKCPCGSGLKFKKCCKLNKYR